VLEGGDAPERMALEVGGRRAARCKDVDLLQAVGDAFLFQRQADAPHIHAVSAAENDRFVHDPHPRSKPRP
jgi:hypothetical protein